MMEPKDIQEEYADALRALLEKNTIARRRNLWDVFCRAIARAVAAEAEVERLKRRVVELEDFLSAYRIVKDEPGI